MLHITKNPVIGLVAHVPLPFPEQEMFELHKWWIDVKVIEFLYPSCTN